MIKFERNRQQSIPESAVKIIGLGGAGANMLDRVALDGNEEAELLVLNTDVRTLASSVAGEKIQLGRNLTKGLGAGGDPELGENSILEAEAEVRDAIRDRKIVFLCVGLGGGTGSGAAPIVTRLAREAGAFVVVFATMPFAFEGHRRRVQAEEALNQLAVLANALVTFDNGRMGELVLPKQGVHEAFSAADRMISDSINAVSRLVLRPGLINVGLDELMTALNTTRSRCLFGSGLSRGESRAKGALKAALESPLLDRGALLEDATTVLIHICGGEDMTLFEVDLLMEGLMKHVSDQAHVLFGAATDDTMTDAMSVTIISALPEDRLKTTGPVEVAAAMEKISDFPKPKPVPELDEEEKGEVAELEGLEEVSPPEVTLDEELEIEEALEDEIDEITLANDLPTEEVKQAQGEPELKVIERETLRQEEAGEIQDATEEDFFEAEEEELGEGKKGAGFLPSSKGQGELELEGGPKGRFDGEEPNIEDGEDLDVPPYLRKKRRR